MSLPDYSGQLPLFGVRNLLHDQLPEDDPFRLFADKIYPLLAAARGDLARCYCLDNGRPGVEPVLLLGVSLLQFMERRPDRQAVQMLKYHLGWKAALQLELRLQEFDPSTLVHFRRRLLDNRQAKLIFDTILKGLLDAGLVSRRSHRRLDSTHVLGLLADLSSADRLWQTMRLALRELQKHPALARPDFWAAMWERYVQSDLETRLEPEQLKQRFVALGQDMLTLWQWLGQQAAAVQQGQHAQLLKRVLEENFDLTQDLLQPRPQMGSTPDS